MPLDGSAEPTLFLGTEADEGAARLSPDGRFVAYLSDESGRNEVYLKSFPSGEGKWQVSIEGGLHARWSRDGRRLFYVDSNRLYRVEVDTGRGVTLSTPEELFAGEADRLQLYRGYEVGPEPGAERFIVVQQLEQSPDEAPMNGIFVVENWVGEFGE